MFERRLKTILVCFVVAMGVVVLRLIDLQVVNADIYREQAERALLTPPKTLDFVRGRILDRFGTVLASDQPCWQVSVAYDILASDAEYIPWSELAEFGGEIVETLLDRRDVIVRRVRRWRRVSSERRGYDLPIREELLAHPILTGLDDQQQIDARETFGGYDGIRVEHSSHRVYAPSASLGHILGQLGAVGADLIHDDVHADDPLARYLSTDRAGVSGVEFAAESVLRGRRGRMRYNRRGEIVEHEPPMDGSDVSLALRLDLQDSLYELLGEMVYQKAPLAPGASLVVLHVPTREALAMVSYPGYDDNDFRRRYREMRDDTIHTPLRFRAVANSYEPGSIVKPLTCLAALGAGVITTETTFHCDGYFLEDDHDRLRCWQIAGTKTRKAHGDVNVSAAISGSCNVFMYHLGELLGADRLCDYFDRAGFGRASGIGLREESRGINPTPGWLMRYRNVTAGLGHARNFAIGQGELSVTPVQAANLMATYANGVSRAVTLIRGGSPSASTNIPAAPDHWKAVRDGVFRVTNDRTGTAYRTAHWTNGRYALCGKTGSATTHPKPTAYRIRYDDGSGKVQYAVLPGKVRKFAIEDFRRDHPDATFDPRTDVRVESVWPPPLPPDIEDKYSHAWFAGYLQRIDADGQPVCGEHPPIAFALVVEYGGSGGRTSGPIAREVARVICETLGDDLDPDAIVEGPQP